MLCETIFTITMLGGLMTHVGDNVDERDHLVILDDREHLPALFVEGDDLDPMVPGGHRFVRLKKGDRITIDLPRGDAKTKAPFNDHTISLKAVLLGGDVDDDVQMATPHNAALAYLVYPDGELFIDSLFKKKAKLVVAGQQLGNQQCVANAVRFEAKVPDAQSKITLTIKNGAEMVNIGLQRNATVYVVNSGFFAGHGPHFRKYKLLSSTAAHIVDVEEGDPCTEAAAVNDVFVSSLKNRPSLIPFIDILVGTHPECTNTDWP